MPARPYRVLIAFSIEAKPECWGTYATPGAAERRAAYLRNDGYGDAYVDGPPDENVALPDPEQVRRLEELAVVTGRRLIRPGSRTIAGVLRNVWRELRTADDSRASSQQRRAAYDTAVQLLDGLSDTSQPERLRVVRPDGT